MANGDDRIFDAMRRPELVFDDLVYKLKTLWVQGVEVTQGMQRYRSHEHLTDAANHGPDNSVTLVGNKPAWVRVYVRSLFGAVEGVTGTLTIDRWLFPNLYQNVAVLDPEPPGTVTATTMADYAAVRGNLDATLNFVVPADLVHCDLRFTAQVQAPGGGADTHTLTVDASLKQTLRMRIVPVSYDGPDMGGNNTTIAAPTLAEAQATAAWSLLVYPVQSTPQISMTSSVELTVPLTGTPPPGGCTQGWLDVNVLVAQARTADGNQANTFYYGLVPAAVPVGTNTGCASSGVTSGRVGGQTTMAHEFGHALGYPHAPCGNVGTPDPDYPTYAPYGAASIGEYGFDIDAGFVHSPVSRRDYMSYCGPRWISLFNYERSLNRGILNPTYCSKYPWWWDDLLVERPPFLDKFPFPDPPPWIDEVVTIVDVREPVISIIGVRHLDGRVEVRSVTRAVAVPAVQGGEPTTIVAQLLNAGGQPIAQARVLRTAARGGCGGCGPAEGDDPDAYVFQAFIPTTETGTSLRLVDDGEQVWERRAPKRKAERPEAETTTDRKGNVVVRWKLGEREHDSEVWVRYRRGRADPTIVHIAAGTDGAVTLPPDALPPGKGTLEVAVHDGFTEATSTRMSVEVADRPPTLTVLHPYEHRTLRAARTMRLHGVATAGDGSVIEADDAYAWSIDGEEVGRGRDLFVTAPEPGEHRAELTVETRSGTASSAVGFTTVDVDRRES